MDREPVPLPPLGDPLLARLDELSKRRGSRGPFGPPAQPAEAAPSRPSRRPRTVSKRGHPARGARLAALAMSCASTGVLTYVFAKLDGSGSSSQAIAALPAPIATAPLAATPSTTSPLAAPAATTAGQPATTVAPSMPAAFNGDVVNTRYGPVQVQAQISGGALVEVAVVQYPNDDNKSVRINSEALPELRSEALSAQSANVDSVSGATYTSDGYAASLQSAIDQARAAGVTDLV